MAATATVPVLGKAIEVLHAIAEDEGATTQARLARRLSLAPSTCHRILKTFTAHDWLRQTPDNGYALSWGLLPLLRSLGDYQHTFKLFHSPLQELAQQTGLMAKVSIRQGDRALTVLREESPRDLFPSSKIGATFPLAYGSSGACLLSGLPDDEIDEILSASPDEVWKAQTPAQVWKRIRQARAHGVAYDPGHYHTQLHTVSAPVFAVEGKMFCALTLLGWPEDFSGKRLATLKGQVLRAASACQKLLTPSKHTPSHPL